VLLRSRGCVSAAVAAFDLDDVDAALAPMLRREQLRLHVSIGV